ncbi:hypothetical protein E8E11_001218 [Didymella keratinophila]|nr:hypothetical protein E8E11_001218 [Didymella keratinophila]
MQLPTIALLLAVLPAAFAAPAAAPATSEINCHLGDNKCDTNYGKVLICSNDGWFPAETCATEGACQIGAAGNAFCNKKPECTTGASQCDPALYVLKSCNDKGIWETDRKCSKPGCCEIKDGKAVCKAKCGGQKPPLARQVSRQLSGWPKPGDECTPNGEEFCDYAWTQILECAGAIRKFTLKKTCRPGGCTYDLASLKPYCH